MKIAIGSDHAGYELRLLVKDHLEGHGHEVIDVGHHSPAPVDYPVYGRLVGEAVASGQAELGIAICGTGVGISIAANKVPGVRAACVSEPFSALLSRQHNNANVLAFGARVVGPGLALMMVDAWLGGSFAGGRHAERVALISEIEDGRTRD